MITFLSVVTSVKDYVEIAHKLIESDPNLGIKTYTEFGAVFTYLLISLKGFLTDLWTFHWLKNIWSLPIIVPDIASAMVSEVSVLDGYFHNAFNVLETPLAYGQQNLGIYGFEKFMIGFINSFFLFLPTSTAHIITLRRFVMQGLEAGYLAGLGTIAGNVLWLSSIIFGWRFFVIPWLSFDIFRYLLGFFLLVKYMWDSSKERRMFFDDLWNNSGKGKIFMLNFLLALTEQTSIYPFITNMSIGPEASILETFPAENYSQFLVIHGAYITGILVGSLSLLLFTCWFWENPAFSIYLWLISSYGNTKAGRFVTSYYNKTLNFTFTYLTMLCAICSIPYFGLDYTLTNPLGFVPQDRLIDGGLTEKADPSGTGGLNKTAIKEVSFLGVKPTDKNMHLNSNRLISPSKHKWGLPLYKYRGFDASAYGEGNYDFLTVEDLNYGFDRFWWRRKMREHKVHFRLLPGPWLRSLKIKLNTTSSEVLGSKAPRSEFFRIISEQYYHPSFHSNSVDPNLSSKSTLNNSLIPTERLVLGSISNYSNKSAINSGGNNVNILMSKKDLALTNVNKNTEALQLSTLRKFARNINTRIKTSQIAGDYSVLNSEDNINKGDSRSNLFKFLSRPIYSKRWKHIYSKISHNKVSWKSRQQLHYFRNISRKILLQKVPKMAFTELAHGISLAQLTQSNSVANANSLSTSVAQKKLIEPIKQGSDSFKKTVIRQKLSKKERQILRYRTMVLSKNLKTLNHTIKEAPFAASVVAQFKAQTMLHPLKFYLQKEQAFRQKLQYYGSYVGTRNLSVGNNAPYLRTIMKRAFYYYKPTLRWERTISLAKTKDQSQKRKTKKTRTQRKLTIETSVAKQNYLNASMGKAQKDTGEFTVAAKYQYSSKEEVPLSSNDKMSAIPQVNMLSAAQMITKPTHSYYVQGKRASRYKQQIYRDVLQHWYYMPWNRLFLKWDVDAFMNRQPKSHFLTKKEEQLLHLRRFLLSEHYDTLRWYTYMQHYRSMKSRIGPTKSFASRIYNQQFQGTFKKIRHLFAITPSQNQSNDSRELPMTILKFDQPLYNEFPNNSKSLAVDSSVIHEELLADETSVGKEFLYPEDLVSQSSKVIRQYISEATSLREQTIQNFLKEKNYWEFTEFLWKGQKTPVTSSLPLITLAKLNKVDTFMGVAHKEISNDTVNLILPQKDLLNQEFSNVSLTQFETEQWVKLLKESYRRLYARKFYKRFGKKYATSTKKQFDTSNNERKEIQQRFKNRLNSLKVWLISAEASTKKSNVLSKNINSNISLMPPLGIQEAINDSISAANDFVGISSKPLLKPKILELKNKIRRTVSVNSSSLGTKHQVMNLLLSTRLSNIQKNLSLNEYSVNIESRDSINTFRYVESIKQTFKTVLNKIFDSFSLSINRGTQLLMRREDSMIPRQNKMWWREKRKRSRKKHHLKKYLTKELQGDRTNVIDDSRAKRDGQQNDLLFQENFKYFERIAQQSLIPLDSMSPKFKLRNKSDLERFFKNNPNKTNTNFADARLKSTFENDLFKPDTKKYRRKMLQSQMRNVHGLYKPSLTQKKQIKSEKKSGHKKIKNYRSLKTRALSRKLKRIKLSYQLQKWWWNNYLPSVQATSFLGQTNKINGALSEISTKEILENTRNGSNLQIGDRDFKPLAIAQALKIRENLIQQDRLTFGDASSPPLSEAEVKDTLGLASGRNRRSSNEQISYTNKQNSIDPNPINKVYESLFISESKEPKSSVDIKLIEPTNPFPFYAGWDESKRKLIVTTRYLSRREAGFEIIQSSSVAKEKNLDGKSTALANNSVNLLPLQFTAAPIKGVNKGLSSYIGKDLSFNTYNMDQFNRTYQSFYAPIGWKRFQFRHSVLKNWLNFIPNNSQPGSRDSVHGSATASHLDLLQTPLILKGGKVSSYAALNNNLTFLDILNKNDAIKLQKNRHSITEKRFDSTRRSFQTPVKVDTPPLYYSATGPLLTEVLPSHYLSVFANKSRLSRARYLTRLPKSEKFGVSSSVIEYNNYLKLKDSQSAIPDFTLRKRVKPKRKYHAKISNSRKKGEIGPRRRKFMAILSNSIVNQRSSNDGASSAAQLTNPVSSPLSSNEELIRWRPLGKSKKRKNPRKAQASIKRKRSKLSREFRRRQRYPKEFRQVKSALRFQPRSGGFVWPGDYLRLELTKFPKINNSSSTSLNTTHAVNELSLTSEKRIKRKTLNTSASLQKDKKLPFWTVDVSPRKYLLQKHNIKVLKKKLEKAQRSNQIPRRLKELNLLILNMPKKEL
nr:hypothetical chloroplast RF1 [Chlorosarcina stigmatica]